MASAPQISLADFRRYLLDQIPEAIFTIGPDGRITYFNNACVELAGRTPVVGEDSWCAMWKIYDENGVQVAPEESAVATSLHTRTPLRGGELTGERPDGSRFQFLYHTTPLYEDGELAGALALLIDVTAQKQAEAQVRHLEDEVTYLARVAAMGAMGSMLVHELSQPLTAALNYIRAGHRIADRPGSLPAEDIHSALQASEDAIGRASDTLKSLKRMVQRKPSLRTSQSLGELVRDLGDMLPTTLSFSTEIDADADSIFADKVQIEQVLFNLVKNACEAIEGKADGEVIVRAHRAAEMTEICVIDNGPGVPAVAREHLFSPFKSSKPDGLGIGLSICRAIVEQHGGQLRFDGEDEGTRFCFTLPRRADTESARPAPEPAK